VFPLAASKHTQEVCPVCNIPLFLSGHTKYGNQCTEKSPIIKYPYLLLTNQIQSILKVPEVEATLDKWHTKPHYLGKYSDIFNSKMCCHILKASDGLVFFSNLPHKKNGPKGELCISVNLGVNWWVQRY